MSDRMKAIYNKLAQEGGGTWATHMMMDIQEALAAQQDGVREAIPSGLRERVMDKCSAGARCSCLDGNGQWFGQNCESALGRASLEFFKRCLEQGQNNG